MIAIVIAFAAGVLWLQTRAGLPPPAMLAPAFGAALLLAAVSLRLRRGRLFALVCAFALFGAGWSAWRAEVRLADALAAEWEGRDVTVVGHVSALPQEFERGPRFEFTVESVDTPGAGLPRRILLSWYEGVREDEAPPPQLRVGERWRLTVRLKRPHGNLNPHGFDYEAWLIERGIRATGYVRGREPAERLADFVFTPQNLIERGREAVRDRFYALLPEHAYAGVLVALAIGDQRAIAGELWEVFARTGTTHLMSISGLHVTLFAALAAWTAGGLWRRSPSFALRLPAQRAAAFAGALAALAYSLLSGFAVPAMRTFVMVAVVAAARFASRRPPPRRVLALALFFVLLYDPWAVLAPGFWLSFCAVALLFYNGSRIGREATWRRWMREQWVMSAGLLPLLAVLFQRVSLVSPIANALAIPVVSLMVTPLVLAAACLPQPFAGWLLRLAHLLLDLLMQFLHWLAGAPLALWQQAAPPWWMVGLALAGGAWLLAPRALPARWLGACAFLPMLLFEPPRPAPGEAEVAVLDVGQGLAVHVRTAAHELLYDAGPLFSADSDAGERLVVPYLRAMGVRRVDALVVTHADSDHAGGVQSVLAAVPVAQSLLSLPHGHALWGKAPQARPCMAGDAWEWDGVRFSVLHPPPEWREKPPRRSNDMSCVLKVEAGGRALLLASDIEAMSERAMLRGAVDLRAEVLLAPHHGSRTSSTAEFLEAVAPGKVVVAAGYRNRFGHPRQEILDRYHAHGAEVLRTDSHGAVRLHMRHSGVEADMERERQARYWHGR